MDIAIKKSSNLIWANEKIDKIIFEYPFDSNFSYHVDCCLAMQVLVGYISGGNIIIKRNEYVQKLIRDKLQWTKLSSKGQWIIPYQNKYLGFTSSGWIKLKLSEWFNVLNNDVIVWYKNILNSEHDEDFVDKYYANILPEPPYKWTII